MESTNTVLLSIAKASTGLSDDDKALEQFSKLLVIGELKDKGIEDLRNIDSNEVFKREYLYIYDYEVAVYASFLNAADCFVWGIKELSEIVYGVVLLGITRGDILFGFLKKEDILSDKIIVKLEGIKLFETSWLNFINDLKKRN